MSLRARTSDCSTSCPRSSSTCSTQWRHERTTQCLHYRSCFFNNCQGKLLQGSGRRKVLARAGLTIEARRRRPDPIIAPYIIEQRGGQEVNALSFGLLSLFSLRCHASACVLRRNLWLLAGLHRHVSALASKQDHLCGIKDHRRGVLLVGWFVAMDTTVALTANHICRWRLVLWPKCLL